MTATSTASPEPATPPPSPEPRRGARPRLAASSCKPFTGDALARMLAALVEQREGTTDHAGE